MIGSTKAVVNSQAVNAAPVPHDLLTAALAYQSRGWSIVPTKGKKAAGVWKLFQTNAPDPDTLRRLFARSEPTGLAVVLGRVSGGLAVRDFDEADAYHAWRAAHAEEALSLPTVQTHRGFHIYGRLEQEVFADLGDGELRGDSRHIVCLPPSVHPAGDRYAWINPLPDGALPPLPPSLTRGTGGETQATQATQQLRQPTTQQPIACVECVPKPALEAIEATLPHRPGQRNAKVFDLARRLKGLPGLDTSPGMLRAIVMEWHRRALPVIATKNFAETWGDFKVAWLSVKKPALQAAHEAAWRAPHEPIDGSADLGVLAALCRELSNGPGGQFYLACRSVESLFGVSRMGAWRWLKDLQFYGIIEPVKPGTLKDYQATEWRYVAPQGGSDQ